MTMDLADCTRGNSDNAEDGKVKEPLSQIRLDEIRRDVTASASTWAALRQQYPPGESCFERLNFTVSSWSATVNDVTGLGDDLDADEAYSQAAAMAAYGVDILSTALSGQTVDRKLAEQARKLFATLCATLMDTRDRHRCSINRAVVEKVGAFRRILGELDSPPQQTEDISSCSERTERDEQTEDTREAPLHDKVERQYSPMAHGNELQITGSSKNDRRHPYYQGRSQSPDLQQYQQSHDQRTIRRTSATSLLGRSLQDIRLSAQYSVPLPATPKATHQAWASDEVINSSRQRVIRTALLRHGMSESSIVEYIDRHTLLGTNVVAQSSATDSVTKAEDLIADASTITNTKSYNSAVSKNWASVYYQVNQNLNDASYATNSKAYATATWLYGTTQLPPAYVETWAPGYLSRAQELHTQTNPSSSQTESSETSKTSETKDNSAPASIRAMGSYSALLVAAALSVAVSMI
ncbi:hypothetical protein H4S03_004255 [Coemansia sp. S3946]|nr:hypothetical protein H4S03_004255 [Coemansia sp. S3946]